MALQFTERVLSEWTDGRLVVRTVQVFCNGDLCERATLLFQYGRPPPSEYKRMRRITGWNEGPKGGEARHWSAAELDALIQQWLATIPPDQPEDRQIVESVQLVLRNALPNGTEFGCDHLRYQILSNLSTYVETYMSNNAPLGQQCDSLCSGMSGLSC